MSYIHLLKKYPRLANILECHFAEEVACDFDYKYLKRDGLNQRMERSHPCYSETDEEIRRLFSESEAKILLEEDRWFVASFESEQSAQEFIVREIWDQYFPETPFVYDNNTQSNA